jgi:rare lipoprotein A (RlpA)-like double-psi beta-barrel protein
MRGRPKRLVFMGAFAVGWAAALAFVIATSGSGSETRRGERAGRPTARVAQAPAPNAAFAEDPEAYRPLPTPRPTLVEPQAGVPSTVEEGDQPSKQSSTDATRPQTDAEIRAQLRQLKDYYASLPDQLNPTADASQFELTAGQLSGLSGWQTSVASVYFDYGGPLACGGRLRRDQFGVANKNLPCGTMVTFRSGGRALRVPVIDRGPYIAGREWDLTGATAIALSFNGLGPIDWIIG